MAMPTIEDDSPRWSIAAVSRIRVKVQHDSTSYCRLFYNTSTGSIELVPYSDNNDKNDGTQRAIYDDSDANLEDEPYYKSYTATAQDDSRIVEDSFHPDDVIGANLSLDYNFGNPNTFHGMKSYASATFNIYAYPKNKSKRQQQQRSKDHKHYSIDPKCCEDFADARKIIQAIQKMARLCNIIDIDTTTTKSKSRPLKCLVVLNPFSGGGGEASKTGAKNVYQTMVKPMLEEAGVEHDALVTQRGGHARERMAVRNSDNKDKEEEVSDSNNNVNGDDDDSNDNKDDTTMVATDSSNSISTDSEINDITEYDAIISMGGDGILFEMMQGIHARSDEEDIMTKMKFGIVPCGTYNGLAKSILHWSNADYNRMESIFLICKGHTSTLDIASYEVLLSGAEEKPKRYLSFLTFAWGLIADCDYESECLRWLGPLRSDIWGVYRGVLFRRQYRARFSYLPPNNKSEEVVMPVLGKPLPDNWVSLEEDFLVFWVCNTSHAAFNMFTCPMAKMNDGVFHILVVRSSCSRFRLIQLLLKLDSGGHIDCKDVEVIDCVAYQFEPISKVSYNVLDGELLEDGPVQARFVPGGTQFFAGEAVE